MKPVFLIPTSNSQSYETFNIQKNIVVVGSNGAGKTRFGAAIEDINTRINPTIRVHRISAQKNLSLPRAVAPTNISVVESNLFPTGNQQHTRWKHLDPITASSSDYELVVQLLFAKLTERDRKFTEAQRISQVRLDVPDAPIDTLVRIWNDVLPNRSLFFSDGSVLVDSILGRYQGSEMSDGERVILYLIAQCLLVPSNSIIIVDEPEIHLHKSLVNRLWNSIEKECPNQLFIYVTHDLDFAASRHDAYKIWIKSYAGGANFDWIQLPESESLPEALLLQVLGSKKNVLFVEGEKDSLDVAIYQSVYSNYLVIPRSGCSKVIEATKAIRDVPSIHHVSAYGIVDSDYRTPEEVASLLRSGIYTIDVAEVENLLCTEGMLRLVASHQMLDPTTVIEAAKNLVITSLTSEVEAQIASKVENEVKYRLNVFKRTNNTEQGIAVGLAATVAAIDVNAIYRQDKALYEGIIATRDLAKALKYYNRKSLASRMSPIFGLANKEYPELMLRLLNSDKKAEVVAALLPYLPTLPN